MKNIIFLMTLIVGLSIIITTNAQAQTQNNTQVNQTGITNYLEGFQGVTVLYESPKTLVLTIADVSAFGPYDGFWSSIRLCERKRIFNRCCYRVYGNLIVYWRAQHISHLTIQYLCQSDRIEELTIISVVTKYILVLHSIYNLVEMIG